MQYHVTICRYMSVYVGMKIVLIKKYLQMHTHTYTYIQYLLIRTYQHIPAIYTHTRNTNLYWHTCTYLRYLLIQAIPIHSDIPAHTCNTCTYMQYLRIVTYLLIPAIPTYTVLYIHIHVNTYWNLWILANTGQYIQIPAHTYVGQFFLQHSSFFATSQTKNCDVAHTGSYLLIPCDTCI